MAEQDHQPMIEIEVEMLNGRITRDERTNRIGWVERNRHPMPRIKSV